MAIDWNADYGFFGGAAESTPDVTTGYDFTPSVDFGAAATAGAGALSSLDSPFSYGDSGGTYGLSDNPFSLPSMESFGAAPPQGIEAGALSMTPESLRVVGSGSAIPSAPVSRSIGDQLRGLVMDKTGENYDLTKLMKLATGIGALYQSSQASKAAKGMTPAQLQAQLVQNNTQWTPAQALAANRFFNQQVNPNRGVVRAGEGGIRSIMPSRGYAKGGGVSSDLQDLIDAYLNENSSEGVVPLLPTSPLLMTADGRSPIRVHGGDMAEGGEVEMMGPLSHGDYGLVSGEGDGQSDTVQINVSPGEYVFDAETVSMLGNGSNDAGADILDQWREFLREHKRSAANDEIGPESMDPNEYLPGEQ